MNVISYTQDVIVSSLKTIKYNKDYVLNVEGHEPRGSEIIDGNETHKRRRTEE